MKKLIAVLVFASSAAWGMTNMPDGVYQGQGKWTDNQGQTGGYDVTASVQSGVVSSKYTFGGQTKTYEFETKAGSNGNFEVLVGGQKVGEGYCMSVQCHYGISFGDTELEETLTFYQDHFYRIGSKRVNGKIVTWEESMEKQGK